MKFNEDINTNYSIGSPNEEWKRKYGSEAVGNTDRLNDATDTNVGNIDHSVEVSKMMDGDYISRQDAIKAAVEAADDWDGGWNTTREGYITEALKALPSVSRTGYWIKHYEYWECSECHTERAYGNEYCPDCGSHNGDISKPQRGR